MGMDMPRTSQDDELLKPDEVAKILGMTLPAVRKQLYLQQIPGVKKGRQWRTWRSDLDAYMQQFAPPSGQETPPHDR